MHATKNKSPAIAFGAAASSALFSRQRAATKTGPEAKAPQTAIVAFHFRLFFFLSYLLSDGSLFAFVDKPPWSKTIPQEKLGISQSMFTVYIRAVTRIFHKGGSLILELSLIHISEPTRPY